MKIRNLLGGLALGTLVLVGAGAALAQYNSLNYQAQGGGDWEVGGILNILPGGKISIGGVDKTAALAALAKTVTGEAALSGTNPTAVSTGLSSITACVVALKVSTAPGVGTSLVTYGSAGGTLSLYGWKPTSNANPTLIASTGTETVGWSCSGS